MRKETGETVVITTIAIAFKLSKKNDEYHRINLEGSCLDSCTSSLANTPRATYPPYHLNPWQGNTSSVSSSLGFVWCLLRLFEMIAPTTPNDNTLWYANITNCKVAGNQTYHRTNTESKYRRVLPLITSKNIHADPQQKQLYSSTKCVYGERSSTYGRTCVETKPTKPEKSQYQSKRKARLQAGFHTFVYVKYGVSPTMHRQERHNRLWYVQLFHRQNPMHPSFPRNPSRMPAPVCWGMLPVSWRER